MLTVTPLAVEVNLEVFPSSEGSLYCSVVKNSCT